MRVSEILQEGVEQFLELTPSIESHLTDTENPHRITKETLGLGNVSNTKQASEADFSAHRTGDVLDHPDGSVTSVKLANGAVGKAALANGAVTSEKLAEESVLARHLQKQSVTAEHLASPVLTMIASKVEQEAGKGLSQNDFTDDLKHKLEALSVVNWDSTLDMSAFLTRTSPLSVRKTGMSFTEKETTLLLENIAEVTSFDTYPKSKFSSISYMTKAGTFGCSFFKDGKLHCTFQGSGTSPGAVSMITGSVSGYIAAELIDGVLQVHVSNSTVLDKPTILLRYSVPVSQTYGTRLKHVFLRPVSGGNELTAIYFNQYCTRMVIDCFSIDASSNISQKWSQTFTCGGSASFLQQNSKNTAWYSLAVMDYYGTLFLTPADCSNEPYAILGINANGEICQRYLPRPHIIQHAMSLPRDLVLDGDMLYYMTDDGIYRISVSCGAVTRLCSFTSGSYWDKRSLMLLPDGLLCMYGVVKTTGVGTFLLMQAGGEDVMAASRGDFLQFVPAASPLVCRNAGDISPKMEGLFLDTETGQLTSRVYTGYSTYEVL